MEHTEPVTETETPRFQIFESGRLGVRAVLRDNVKEVDYPFGSRYLAFKAIERIRSGSFPGRLFLGSAIRVDAYMVGDLLEAVVA